MDAAYFCVVKKSAGQTGWQRVGFQQYHEDVKIHDDFAVREHGVLLIHRHPWKNDKAESELGVSREDLQIVSGKVPDDEFDEDDSSEQGFSNIDPLFRVDLDELTQGPGFINQLARIAVSIHRVILTAIFYTPLNLIYTLAGIPKALMQTPPALCLLALLVRQLVGKIILNASMPVLETEEKDAAIDVLAMVKQWVTKFLSTTFPTAVSLYDAFVHLRSDMYIIICGVFCGLACTHMSKSTLLVGIEGEL